MRPHIPRLVKISFSKSGGRFPAFILRELAFSWKGNTFFQALLIFAAEVKHHIHYARAGGWADEDFCLDWALRFLHCLKKFLHCSRSFPNCCCFGEWYLGYFVSHKGQLQALLRASASLLTALLEHLSGKRSLYLSQGSHPSFYFDPQLLKII